jgi:hypothetical protein
MSPGQRRSPHSATEAPSEVTTTKLMFPHPTDTTLARVLPRSRASLQGDGVMTQPVLIVGRQMRQHTVLNGAEKGWLVRTPAVADVVAMAEYERSAIVKVANR